MKEMLQIKFDEKSNSYEICYDGFSWVNDGKKAYVTVCRKNGNKEIVKNFPLNSAKAIKTEYQKDKIVTRYSDFYLEGKKLPFTLICTAEKVDSDSVVFSFKSENETEYCIKGAVYPGAFNSKSKGENSYHVDPMRQGFILPDRYMKNFFPICYYTKVKRLINTGDCYFPLWGRVCDGHTFSAIIETPYDA